MNDATELQQAQARLDEVQALYREWLALAPRLEAAQAEWRRAAAVMAQLNRPLSKLSYFKIADGSNECKA